MTARNKLGKDRGRSLADRRRLLAGAAAIGLAAARPGRLFGARADAPRYRVAVIGHTGRGNYGHGLDEVWLEVPKARVVAVAGKSVV